MLHFLSKVFLHCTPFLFLTLSGNSLSAGILNVSLLDMRMALNFSWKKTDLKFSLLKTMGYFLQIKHFDLNKLKIKFRGYYFTLLLYLT